MRTSDSTGIVARILGAEYVLHQRYLANLEVLNTVLGEVHPRLNKYVKEIAKEKAILS